MSKDYPTPMTDAMYERDELRKQVNELRNEIEELKKNQCQCPTEGGELREVVGDTDPVKNVKFIIE
jgi:uncharacterized coiled-coil DUF342 family protein